MNALLLAAGIGSRLQPITKITPKCLVSIGGRPLLQYWLNSLRSTNRFDQVYINTHHHAEQVRDQIRSGCYNNWVNLFHEKKLLGTAQTLLRHKHLLTESTFLVAHADNLTVIDWPAFFAAHDRRPPHAVGTMMTFRTTTPQSCGVVEIDRTGTLLKMHEKAPNPPGNLANAAVYLFDPSVFRIIESQDEKKLFDISLDIVPMLYGKLTTFFNGIYHRDIGTPESLAAANTEFGTEMIRKMSHAIS